MPRSTSDYASEGTIVSTVDGGSRQQYQYNDFIRKRQWTNTPGFANRVRTRKIGPGVYLYAPLPMNTYVDTQLECKIPQSTVVGRYGTTLRQFTGGWADPNPVLGGAADLPLGVHGNLVNRCISKLNTKVNGEQFSVPLFLRDLRSTIEMIHKLAHGVYDQVRQMKVGTRARPENIWLEGRFGWRLLIKDIVSALTAIHEARLRGLVVSGNARCTSTSTSTISRGTSTLIHRTNSTMVCDAIETRNEHHEVFICVNYKDTFGPTMKTFQQFGITNPLGFLWDAIPLSFVLDWVIPVSGYLGSLDVFLGKVFESGCISYLSTYERKIHPVNWRDYYGSWSIDSKISADTTRNERYYKRDVLAGFPTAVLPRADFHVSPLHALDAIALLLQIGGRSVPFRAPRNQLLEV